MKLAFPLLLILAALLTYNSAYIVDTRQVGIQICLGKIDRVVNKTVTDPKKKTSNDKPGLYFHYPFVCEVRRFDKLIITMYGEDKKIATGKAQSEIKKTNNTEKSKGKAKGNGETPAPAAAGSDKNYVEVDYFVTFRIKDAEKYYLKFQGDNDLVRQRIDDYVVSALQDEFKTRDIIQIVSTQRQIIMDEVEKKVNQQIKENDYGFVVVDVRIKKIELDPKIKTAIFTEMKNEREKIATSTRYEGKRQAQRIMAEGDRLNREILAKADRESRETRASGDAQATRIYAAAYNRNKAFYEFHKSLEAYKESFNENDTLVLEPTSEFFKYFGTSKLSK